MGGHTTPSIRHAFPIPHALFCYILFHSIPFHSILFYCILFYSILFYSPCIPRVSPLIFTNVFPVHAQCVPCAFSALPVLYARCSLVHSSVFPVRSLQVPRVFPISPNPNHKINTTLWLILSAMLTPIPERDP